MATTFGVTSTGFVVKRLADIQASLQANLQNVKDANGNAISIDLEDSTLISQLLNIIAEEISEGWSMAGALANQFDPNYNVGPFQSGTVQLNGITRLSGIPTEINVTVSGVGGTVVPVGAGLSYNGNGFALNNAITIGAAATAAGTVTMASVPADGDTVQIGNITYTFRTTTMTNPFSVRREPVGAPTVSGCAAALVLALNASGTAGTDYGTGTYDNPLVGTASSSGAVVTVPAAAPGTNGNAVTLYGGQLSITTSGATLSGGMAYGTGTGTATATQSTAPVVVPSNAALAISTPVNGWIGALSGTTVIAGTAQESDEALRIRQQISTQVVAARESSAIISAVQACAGVSFAVLYENPGPGAMAMTGGASIPAGSICVLTNGGSNADIATAIYNKMSCMTQTSGAGLANTVSVVIGTNTINFATVNFQTIIVNVNVMPTGATLPTGTAAAIQAAVATWGNSYYAPNQTVYASDIYKALTGLSGFYVTSISLGFAAGGSSSYLAGGAITFSAAPTAGDTVTIGNTTYRFESTLSQANDVKIGTQAATMLSLQNAINGTGVAGTDYFAGTTKNLLAGVTSSDTNDLYLTARMAGTDGNLIQLAKSSTHITVSGTTLAGGSITVDGQTEIVNFGYQASFVNDPTKVFVNQM